MGEPSLLSVDQSVNETVVDRAHPTVDPRALHERGQVAYDQGQFAEAVQDWQDALVGFEAVGDGRSHALTLCHLAIAHQALGHWSAAITTLDHARQLAQSLNDPFVSAQVLMGEGSQALHQGRGEEALARWQQAEAQYRAIADESGILQSQLNQAQALQTLGNHHQSFNTLDQLTDTIHDLSPSALKVTGLHTVGITLQSIGEWPQAQTLFEESLAIAQQLQLSSLEADIHLSLGNLFRAQANVPQALQQYEQASGAIASPHTQLTAQLNRFSLLAHQGDTDTVQILLPSIQDHLNRLPVSRTSVYAHVNLAESLITLNRHPKSKIQNPKFSAHLLTTAIEQARMLNDTNAEAYALGELGHLYEIHQQWSHALELSVTAIQLAQSIQAKEIVMPWQWQQGRILKALGETDGAIAAYTNAVTTINDLRHNLVSLSPDLQFSFREQVEPIYRQLVELHLNHADALAEGAEKQAELKRSRQLIEDLQLANLDNFFRQACLDSTPQDIEQIDDHAAVIYPIFLNPGTEDQRLDVVVSWVNPNSGGSELMHYGRAIAARESEQLMATIQGRLTPLYDKNDILPTAQTLYQWLLAPAKPLLAQQSIHTLVFVLDGVLRNLPMAVLHDGEQFLVEKYTIALSPGLQLLPPISEHPLDIANQPRTLTSGLSEERPGFTALPNVVTEIEQVQELVPTQVLLNQSFVKANLQERLPRIAPTIVHFATHGQFSSNVEDTFLLTWDNRLTIQELEALLTEQGDRHPIDLLILSACQTARGDHRATLGLAGMAVRAGARSTLATLWSISDASTAELVTDFYQKLTDQNTKADALRQAQLSLLHSKNYAHPYFWAPFVLVGNWQ